MTTIRDVVNLLKNLFEIIMEFFGPIFESLFNQGEGEGEGETTETPEA